jgi:hypothetical protein
MDFSKNARRGEERGHSTYEIRRNVILFGFDPVLQLQLRSFRSKPKSP